MRQLSGGLIGRGRDERDFVGKLPLERVGWGEVLFVAQGSLDVEVRGTYWQLREGQGLWHPGEGLDSATVWGEARVLRLGVAEPLSLGPRLLRGSGLLRESLVRLGESGKVRAGDPMIRVALAEVESALSIPLTPPWPRSVWASKAALVLRDVGPSEMSIDWLAGKLEMSRRSLERRFAHETGLSPADWRREARLIESLRLLSMGTRGELWATVGFKSRSAFYGAFRARFGLGPARFWDNFVQGCST